MIEPTQDQIDVQNSQAQVNVIFGNAGAAKTMTLAMTIRKLLMAGHAPEAILVLTYTDAAVLALRQRLRWLGLRADQVLDIRATTFKALCHERLEPFEGKCPHLVHPTRVVHDTLSKAVILARERAERMGHLDAFEIYGDGVATFPHLLHTFDRMKGTMVLQSLGDEFVLTPESADDVGIRYTEVAVFRAYEYLRRGRIGAEEVWRNEEGEIEKAELEALYRLEDDPVYDMAMVLEASDPIFNDKNHPLKLNTQFLFIDEAHDLNVAMFTVLRHMMNTNPVQQMFVVGDPDQVIHSDTGAEHHFMTDTRGFGNSSKSFTLPLCRRFGAGLATPLGVHANKPYKFLSTNETVVSIYKVAGNDTLASFVVASHRRASATDSDRVPSLAVVLRHPGESVLLEDSLALEGFHVETNGFEPYLQRPEVHFLRVLLAWAGDAMDTLANADLTAIQRALGEFTGFSRRSKTRGVQHKTLTTFSPYVFGSSPTAFLGNQEAHLKPAPLLYYSDIAATKAIRNFLHDFLSGITTAALPSLLESTDFKSLAKRAFVFDERVDEAVKAMRAFAKSAAGFSDFRSWLQQMANREHFAAKQGRGARPVLRLYSISAAKGLEFDHVIIPGVEGNSFDGRQQEEKNLFYVAASRARRELTLMYRSTPSSYLEPFQDSAHWAELH